MSTTRSHDDDLEHFMHAEMPSPPLTYSCAAGAVAMIRRGLAPVPLKPQTEVSHQPKNFVVPFTSEREAEIYFGCSCFGLGLDLERSRVVAVRIYNIDHARIGLRACDVDVDVLLAAGAQASLWIPGGRRAFFRLPSEITSATTTTLAWPALGSRTRVSVVEIRCANRFELMPPSFAPTGERVTWLPAPVCVWPEIPVLPLAFLSLVTRQSDVRDLFDRACPWRPRDVFDMAPRTPTSAAAVVRTPTSTGITSTSSPMDDDGDEGPAAGLWLPPIRRSPRRRFAPIDWVALRALPVDLLLAGSGLQVTPRGISPCPACGASQRGSMDKRPPMGLGRGRHGAKCHRCGFSGDGLKILARILGAAKCDGRVITHLQAHGVLPPATSTRRSSNAKQIVPLITVEPSVPEVIRRPPLDEVCSLWGKCLSVLADDEIRTQLTARGIDPVIIAHADAARVLPRTLAVPSWAGQGDIKWTRDHRVIIPLVDADGVMRSVHARALVPLAPLPDRSRPKGQNPQGVGEIHGLTMACPTALAMLRARERPARIAVAEGGTDFLSLIVVNARRSLKDAVLGYVGGGIDDAVISRIPDDLVIVIATDNDKTGHEYAAKLNEMIRRVKGERVQVQRWMAPTRKDP